MKETSQVRFGGGGGGVGGRVGEGAWPRLEGVSRPSESCHMSLKEQLRASPPPALRRTSEGQTRHSRLEEENLNSGS